MDREKGLAFCGLVCAACSENENCIGCRSSGCKDREWCGNFMCCTQKGLKGCWECRDFPCKGSMLDKPRIRAFAKFVREYGEEKMLACMERNEAEGIQYHYPGQLTGDYDTPQTEKGIMSLLLFGI